MKVNQKYTDDIAFLDDRNGLRRAKYRRNLRAYYHTYGFGMSNISDTAVAGYYSSSATDIEEDTSSGIQENVIKSCIDTLVSKIASQKVRPFFNTINGTFKDMQIVKQSQQYFDQLFDENNINKIVTDAFRDACIFDRGIIYVDKESHIISRVLPWQVNIDNREASYNSLTRIGWKLENYPVTLLPFKSNKITSATQDVTYHRYWNLLDHKFVEYCPELEYYKESEWEEPLPFIFLYYDNPIKSGSTISIVDQLWGLQEAIDAILVKIKDASQLASPLKFFVPDTSTIKVNKLSNRVGEIVTYTALPNQTTPPIVTAAEPFMDPQWQQLLDKFKQDAYEACGISQLSATSQKPKGLNSGVALSTMEDIEGDRFEVQLNNVIRIYTEIAKLCISLFDENEDILPANRNRQSIKWIDIVEAKDQLVIQFSAAENLSKDPQTRAQQVQMLVQMGAIPQSRVAALMEIPDSVQGYSLANNAINAVMAIIDDCIEKGIQEVPDYIPTQMLMSEILNTCLSLKAANNAENENDINKLLALYDTLSQKEQNSMTSAEMMAVQTLQQEITEDMQNPDGQFARQMEKAMQTLDAQEEELSNNIEPQQEGM